MIINPVVVTSKESYVSALRKALGKTIICRDTWEDDWLFCGISRINHSVMCGVSVDIVWSIDYHRRWDGDMYRFGEEFHLDREEFFERLKQYYPEHLEWFLFHPELL